MKTNNKISDIWNKQEEEKSIGLVKRLYSSDMPFHIYGTFQYPEYYYGIAFSINKEIRIDISSFNNLRELKILLVNDNTYKGSYLLIVQLLQQHNRDIFATLCENLINSVISLNTEQQVIRAVINQLEKWKTLFEKSSSNGLSSNEQQGLWGELHFLQKILLKHENDMSNALQKWVGTDKALRDFQGEKWAIEVKTTSTNNPQKVIINGERQLDETTLENLFLFHISLEISNNNGETLCQKIAFIRELLKNNSLALSIFNAKLFEIGYNDNHENLYQDRFYQIRDENYYKVENDFPRIKENELRKGISDVKYSIILATCDEYLISEKQIMDIITR
ncbi:MAG: PD-(D/E)XK motif protein [Candidatus Cloacimonetes bacterium]|nr:PD-(D/E)XK motif protein [Candidatus Cloacimonadota bacterium]